MDAKDLSLGGYCKNYLFLFDPASAGPESSWTGLWTNRFRLHLSYKPQSWATLDAAYDLAPKVRSRALSGDPLLFRQIDPFIYRAADLNSAPYPAGTNAIGHFALGQNLDRAAVTFHTRPADITIGRQAIAWGSAHAVNPTDVLAPFSFEALDTEDRIGIDAVRARLPLGTLSEIDAGYVFGKDFKFSNSAFYGRTKFNVRKADIAVLLMGFRENLLAGFDLTRAIRGAGFWVETAYVFVDALQDPKAGPRRNYLRLSSGMDYSFTNRSYGFIEYHFNGAGKSLPADYLKSFAEPAYTEGSVYLMGRHYIIPGISFQASPLMTLIGQSLINVTDPSLFLTPQMEYNIANNAYIGAGAFIGVGKRAAAEVKGGLSALRSEFGGYPNIYFGSVRYYF